jgi:hypothetical protein
MPSKVLIDIASEGASGLPALNPSGGLSNVQEQLDDRARTVDLIAVEARQDDVEDALGAVTARQDNVEAELSGALSSSAYRPTPEDGADLPIGTYFLSPNAGDAGAVWVYQRVAGAPGYLAINRQEFSADQIADGTDKVSMTVGERETVEMAATPNVYEPRVVPGKNDDDTTGTIIARDASGRALIRAAPASLIGRVTDTETGVSDLETLVGPAPLRVEIYEPRVVPGKATARQPLVKTPTGKVLLWDRPGEVSEAITAIDTRISRTLDTNGMPLAPIYGEWHLRRSHAKFQALAAGIAGSQMSIYLPGDSWIDNINYNGRVFANRVRTAYGNGAIGWVGLRTDPINSNLWITSTGAWTIVDETAASPDLYAVTSSTATSARTINGGSQAPIPTGARLQWKGTADGVIRYRTGSGTWSTLNVQGSGIQHADLADLPTSAPWTMTFEVVSGSVDLRGVIFAGTSSGVIVHKGGNSGSHTNDWVGVDRAEYIAAIAELTMDLVILPFGVNDQAVPISPEQFLANTLEIIDRIRTARPTTGGQPGPDFLVSIPPELKNRLANGRSMVPYWTELLNVADEYRFAVVGLPPVFGPVPADYDAWMDTDLIHPAPTSLDPLTLASNLITRSWCETIGAFKAI